MPIVILKGSPQAQWNFDGSYKPGGTEIELTDSEIKKYKDCVAEVISEKKPKIEKVENVPKPKKVYTEEQLDKKGRTWQINFLKKNEVVPARKEKDRIKQIMRLQK